MESEIRGLEETDPNTMTQSYNQQAKKLGLTNECLFNHCLTNDYTVNHWRLLAMTLCIAALVITTAAQTVQADAIYRVKGGRLTGTVQSVSPVAVVVETDRGTQTVDAWNVTSIAVEGQPLELRKARKRYEDERFDECLEELQRIDVDPDHKAWQPEFDFLQAAASAQVSLSGGNVTAQQAGKAVNGFLRKHPENNLKFPATEMFFPASGKVNLDQTTNLKRILKKGNLTLSFD